MKNEEQRTSGLHIAIIPDGNRRWAKKRAMQPWKGHESAFDSMKNIAEWCRDDPRVSVLTLWVFSTENWNRDEREVSELMKLLRSSLENQRASFIKYKMRCIHSGRKDRLEPSLAKLIHDVEEETKNFDVFTLNIALDYGGRDEVVRAVQKIGDVKNLTEQQIHENLDHPELPDIDMIIRTSGEKRTSNFALWQSAYAEWIFTEKYFPDMTTEDMREALAEYENRKRRFGT